MLFRARNIHNIHWAGDLFNQENLSFDYVSISMGAFDLLIPFFWLLGKRCCKLWVGTDVLKCTKFAHYRIRAKLASLFCTNITDTPWLCDELNRSGIYSRSIIHNDYLSILAKKCSEGC